MENATAPLRAWIVGAYTDTEALCMHKFNFDGTTSTFTVGQKINNTEIENFRQHGEDIMVNFKNGESINLMKLK